MVDTSNLPAILHARSYTEDDLQAIAHGSFLRLIDAAWRQQFAPLTRQKCPTKLEKRNGLLDMSFQEDVYRTAIKNSLGFEAERAYNR